MVLARASNSTWLQLGKRGTHWACKPANPWPLACQDSPVCPCPHATHAWACRAILDLLPHSTTILHQPATASCFPAPVQHDRHAACDHKSWQLR